MLKPIVVATAALALAGSSVVYAQHCGGPGGLADHGQHFEYHHRFSIDDIKAFTDARIAALKAGLQLTPDQQKDWPAFEQALRGLAQLRLERIEHMRARLAATEQGTQAQTSPFDRLARRADHLAKVGAALKQLAATGAPLYQSLNDAQKERFRVLARVLRPHGMGAGFWHHGMMDRGFGGGGMPGMMGPGGAGGGMHGMMETRPDAGGHGMMTPQEDQVTDCL